MLISKTKEKEKIMKYSTAVEKCFNRCNLIGEDVDIWDQMMRYKALREASEAMQEEAYITIATRLGFISHYWTSDKIGGRYGKEKN